MEITVSQANKKLIIDAVRCEISGRDKISVWDKLGVKVDVSFKNTKQRDECLVKLLKDGNTNPTKR